MLIRLPLPTLMQVLEESDDDSGDDWMPAAAAARLRGSSEEAGSGSGVGRGLAGGSNTPSSMPPRRSPSSEEAVNEAVPPQQKKQRLEMTPPVVTGRTVPLLFCSLIDGVMHCVAVVGLAETFAEILYTGPAMLGVALLERCWEMA